jgi:drug/metabolite transporter (DMT)-like permease
MRLDHATKKNGDAVTSALTSTRKEHLDTIAIASMLLCGVLWGLGQVAAKVAVAEIPPLAQAALRSLGAAVLVGLWARSRGLALFDRDGSLRGGLLAGALFAAEFACIFVGLQYTSASRMVVFIYLSPFVVALGMPFIARSERLSALQALGLMLAFAGVAWAFAEGFSRPAAGPSQWLGDALGVLAAVLWGATTLVIRGSRLSSVSAEKTLFYQLAVSAAALAVATLAAGEAWPAHASPLAWSAFAFQTVVVSFASYLLWFWLVRHYAATRLASFTLLTPLFGLLFGVLLLGEPATQRLLLALAAVAAGIVLVNRTR